MSHYSNYMEAWASAMEALLAWAMAMAVDMEASEYWAMAVASEATDMALVMETTVTAAVTIHRAMEDMDSLVFTKENGNWMQRENLQICLVLFCAFIPKTSTLFYPGSINSIYQWLQCPYEYLVTFYL